MFPAEGEHLVQNYRRRRGNEARLPESELYFTGNIAHWPTALRTMWSIRRT